WNGTPTFAVVVLTPSTKSDGLPGFNTPSRLDQVAGAAQSLTVFPRESSAVAVTANPTPARTGPETRTPTVANGSTSTGASRSLVVPSPTSLSPQHSVASALVSAQV